MSHKLRFTIFFIIDSLIVLSSITMSHFLLESSFSFHIDHFIITSSITLLISHHIMMFFCHLYDRIWSVASVKELLIIFYSVTVSTLITCAMQFLVYGKVNFRIMVITWLFLAVLIGGSRFVLRLLFDYKIQKKPRNKLTRVLIVGAGEASSILIRSIKRRQNPEYVIVGLVDDNPHKQNLTFMNVKVCGTSKDIPRIVKEKEVEIIILAIPSLGKIGIKRIYDICLETNAIIKTMPKIEDLMLGKVSVNDIQDVKIEQLLGREEVKMDMEAISNNLLDKTILVTGAGGSIGSEICRQITHFNPKKLILLGHGENSIYKIHLELTEKKENSRINIIPIIADVKEREKIFEIVQHYRPDVIYHAAAHKHVPLMENNVKEAVQNNIFGTKNIADAAHAFGVSNFVMISSDKAVNPTNVMGATKRIAEMIIQNLATQSDTNFAAVRFGNVLGSRGSVVPRFKHQILSGGPITVTDPEMTRYFMTIPEASCLVIQAGALAQGGEVFVLDMGEPIKIVELARNLIRLSGFTEKEIPIKFTGIRPGEKMYEELLNPEEIQEKNIYPKIHVGKAHVMSGQHLMEFLSLLNQLNVEDLKQKVIDVANGKWRQAIASSNNVDETVQKVEERGEIINKKIYLSSPHMSSQGYEKQFVEEAFDTNWISPLGRNVDMFEKELVEKIGSQYSVALSSGTAAIHMALKAVGVDKGDIVFCSSLTFAATANPIIYLQAVPVFIDSDEETWNMSPTALEEAFIKYPNVKAVIVVHIYGLSAQMSDIMDICNKYEVPVIEDAAESLGTTFKNKQTGTFGEFGVFSFNGNKIITTSGGGMLVSKSKEKIDKVKFWSTQSKDKARYYQHSELGFNYRMSNVLAGIGRGQLKVLDERLKKKRAIFEYYKNALSQLYDINFMPINDWNCPNFWLSCITLKGKIRPIRVIEALEMENIEARHVWKPMHMQPFFNHCDFIGTGVSQKLFEDGVCLPSDTKMTEQDLERVVETIKKLL